MRTKTIFTVAGGDEITSYDYLYAGEPGRIITLFFSLTLFAFRTVECQILSLDRDELTRKGVTRHYTVKVLRAVG